MCPTEGPGPKSSIGVDPTYWPLFEPGNSKWSGYRGATVCRLGHPHFTALLGPPDAVLGFCPKCGAPMVGRCANCQLRIRDSGHEVHEQRHPDHLADYPEPCVPGPVADVDRLSRHQHKRRGGACPRPAQGQPGG
ncbi:DUF2321 domain-containing protein [Actinospica sp. MGRD01-02]|uniref:DUF2321 domain-containing protein n=1 Tax=Actinospica acidithermotolerans TaxID=2828514 RepID=A0A941IN41_9ACTN|nr:DUF2321 domain-containing protein [Actinospica acidithermotolerans]